MAVTCVEDIKSRRYSGDGSITLLYIVKGTDDDGDAMDAVDGAAPASFQGRIKPDYYDLAASMADTHTEAGIWRAELKYQFATLTRFAVGTIKLTIDTSVEMVHYTHTPPEGALVNTYAPPGVTAPDFKGGIGYERSGSSGRFAGVDVPRPHIRFEVLAVKVAAGSPTNDFLYASGGAVNGASFKVTDTISGRSITLAAGECMFMGGNVSDRDDGLLEFRYQFEGSKNATNVSVGGITGITKAGTNYLWLYSLEKDDLDATPPRLVQTPQAVYVHRMSPVINFAGFGVS